MDINWLSLISNIGVSFFAMSGALVALENELDIVGLVTLGTLSGLGGGIIRDIFLGILPPSSIVLYPNLINCFVSSIAAFFYYKAIKKLELLIVIVDAIGLGVFLVLGMEKAVDYHMNTLSVIMMGIFTCSFGGVIRDILINRLPFIFRREIYLFNALVGAVFFVFLQGYLERWLVDTIVALIVIVLRLLSYFKHWQLMSTRYKF